MLTLRLSSSKEINVWFSKEMSDGNDVTLKEGLVEY